MMVSFKILLSLRTVHSWQLRLKKVSECGTLRMASCSQSSPIPPVRKVLLSLLMDDCLPVEVGNNAFKFDRPMVRCSGSYPRQTTQKALPFLPMVTCSARVLVHQWLFGV